ncbi:class I SAM-dependent methyltransferase [Paraburkholderia edwinii]|uniref:Class I SAM-dependent methyltransferase n=1 Tax=Paraburkholderia edwinii TaxID=2861782 RepID=A0ABX8UM62_9BURK|nr:class I SAM-dependent methyltransferase [Paraburkholderia edwinii]QYD70098.1 class I SAM-dependent methyltransferase [Paraburkholderia edwinii]
MEFAAILNRAVAREGREKYRRFVSQYIDALALSGTETVLDLACGTGGFARALAMRPGFKGSITAIDNSVELIRMARQLAYKEGVDGLINFSAAQLHRLGHPSGTFDVVVVHTLLSNDVDPALVLAEARRTLRPGQKLVLFHGDWRGCAAR